MPRNYQKELHATVTNFKAYQQRIFPEMTEHNDNGEWVFGNEFDNMQRAYLGVIKNLSPMQADDALLDDMLYAIARDNECSSLMPATLDRPEWFARVCQHSLHSGYINARWQFAENLCKYKGNEAVRALIFAFLKTGEEYTERMALYSLSKMYPEQTEMYAIDFWNRDKYKNSEYQKMMVLHVLDNIHSPLLEQYLSKAENQEAPYLKKYALEIRDRRSCDR